MLWLLLSYVPARIFYYMAAYAIMICHYAIAKSFILGSPDSLAWLVVISFVLLYLALWPIASDFLNARISGRLGKQARAAQAKIPANALRLIDVTKLTAHFLAVRTGGAVVLLMVFVNLVAAASFLGLTFVNQEIFIDHLSGAIAHLSKSTRTDLVTYLGYTEIFFFSFWGVPILGAIIIRQALEPRALSYTIGAILLLPGACVLAGTLVSLVAAHPLVLLLVILLGGAPFIGIAWLGLRIILGTKHMARQSLSGSSPSLHASLADIPREKMVLFGEGLPARASNAYVPWRKCSGFVFVLMVLASILLLLGILAPSHLAFRSLWFALLGLPLSGLSLYVWDISKRLRLRSANEVLASDTRAPVLVLRSFIDDKVNVQGRAFFRMRERVLESASKWCFQLGPVITFGRPGEKIARSGPPRMYVKHNGWQNVLGEYLAESRLIVIVVGETQTLRWEIERIIDKGLLHKTIFVVPHLRINDIKVRWEKLLEIFPTPTRVRPGLPNRSATRALLERTRALLEAIDPSTALLIGYDQDKLFCLSSKLRNRLAYDIAFKTVVDYFSQKRTVEWDGLCVKYAQPSPAPSSSVPAP